MIYSEMIYNLRKLDSIDIVDKFNYLVIFKEAEQEKYYVKLLKMDCKSLL